MAARPKARRPNVASPKIREAIFGPHGVVYKGPVLTKAEAIEHRQNGGDVVICGTDTRANRQLAKDIEDAVGPNIHHDPHLGPSSLPHYQPNPRPPEGHSFYERVLAKAHKLP
jgi:hypothetical protein